MEDTRIYLDNNASTQVVGEVVQEMADHLSGCLGNPSSIHSYGMQAKQELLAARRNVADFFSVKPKNIVFTSGGTEAVNLAIKGHCHTRGKGHIITSDLEHSAVVNSVKALENEGFTSTFLSPGPHGAATPEQIEDAIRDDTILIVLMAVNNETGVKTDVDKIAALAKRRGIPLVIDGIAWLGKECITLPEGVSAACFSGHKIHGPKGVGLVVLRRDMPLQPVLTGGFQEGHRRAGTENLVGIVGLSKAIDLLRTELPKATEQVREMRDHFEKQLQSSLDGIVVNGSGERVANTANIGFEGVDGESLLLNLDMEGIAVSHGSACTAGAIEPSRVLLNMGIPHGLARSSVRFSLSRLNTMEEMERTLKTLCALVPRLRGR